MKYVAVTIGLLLMVVANMVGIAVGEQQSVSLGGHILTADLPVGWVLSNDSKPEAFDSSNPEDTPNGANVIGTWKGTYSCAFEFLGYPNAPKENDYRSVTTGSVCIYILKVPIELKQSLQEKEIAAFGSVDKIPDDRKAEDIQKVLLDAEYVTKIDYQKFDSDKAITFGDRDARLFERDNGFSVGDIAISLDPNTVAVISASVNKKHISGQEDAALFDGRAWDIINTITVT